MSCFLFLLSRAALSLPPSSPPAYEPFIFSASIFVLNVRVCLDFKRSILVLNPPSHPQPRPHSQLAQELKQHIPEGPPLFGNDVMSDKPQRFFAAEIIREQIFGCFSQEVCTPRPHAQRWAFFAFCAGFEILLRDTAVLSYAQASRAAIGLPANLLAAERFCLIFGNADDEERG